MPDCGHIFFQGRDSTVLCAATNLLAVSEKDGEVALEVKEGFSGRIVVRIPPATPTHSCSTYVTVPSSLSVVKISRKRRQSSIGKKAVKKPKRTLFEFFPPSDTSLKDSVLSDDVSLVSNQLHQSTVMEQDSASIVAAENVSVWKEAIECMRESHDDSDQVPTHSRCASQRSKHVSFCDTVFVLGEDECCPPLINFPRHNILKDMCGKLPNFPIQRQKRNIKKFEERDITIIGEAMEGMLWGAAAVSMSQSQVCAGSTVEAVHTQLSFVHIFSDLFLGDDLWWGRLSQWPYSKRLLCAQSLV